jgi:hypothetical protein
MYSLSILPISEILQKFRYIEIHAFWQFYRYERDITRFFRFDIYRVVGATADFRTAKKPVISADTSSPT